MKTVCLRGSETVIGTIFGKVESRWKVVSCPKNRWFGDKKLCLEECRPPWKMVVGFHVRKRFHLVCCHYKQVWDTCQL